MARAAPGHPLRFDVGRITEIDNFWHGFRVLLMNVSLTPELEKWVQSKVETGLYGSSSEVVRDALRLLHQFEFERIRKFDELRSDLQVGLEQLRAGRGREFDRSLVDEIKKRGRERISG
jgi:antitoxin ParD1/3/4